MTQTIDGMLRPSQVAGTTYVVGRYPFSGDGLMRVGDTIASVVIDDTALTVTTSAQTICIDLPSGAHVRPPMTTRMREQLERIRDEVVSRSAAMRVAVPDPIRALETLLATADGPDVNWEEIRDEPYG